MSATGSPDAAGCRPGASGPERPAAALRPLRIGLTGPIGCGKSTVAGWLAERGAAVIDADAARARGDGAGRAGARGGPRPLRRRRTAGRTAALDRAALGRLVFADAAALARPGGDRPPGGPAAHRGRRRRRGGEPGRRRSSSRRSSSSRAASRPTATRSGWSSATPAEQRARLAGRGMAADDAERRIAAQGDIVGRLRDAATRVIDTSGGTAGAKARVAEAYAAALARHAIGDRPAAG